jgi:hypothetical protein
MTLIRGICESYAKADEPLTASLAQSILTLIAEVGESKGVCCPAILKKKRHYKQMSKRLRKELEVAREREEGLIIRIK